jgi:hypothetical protein
MRVPCPREYPTAGHANRVLEKERRPQGMSIGAHITEDTVLPYEVSVTRNPAFEDALVCRSRRAATWEMLTEDGRPGR